MVLPRGGGSAQWEEEQQTQHASAVLLESSSRGKALLHIGRTEQATETMKPSSGLPSGRLIPWQGLLLTASLLTFWNPPTSAQLTVETMPSIVAEDSNVLLLVHNLPENLRLYRWYKGANIFKSHRIAVYETSTQAVRPGSAYSGRETIYPNGSLLLQNVRQEDMGLYTLITVNTSRQTQQASGQVQVYPMLPKPSITSNNSNPVEGQDSVELMCEPEIQNTTYLWWRNGQKFLGSNRLRLSKGNTALTLLRVTRNDTGPYECGTWNPLSANQSDPVTLNILYGPDTPLILPTDSYFRSGTNLSLSCHAVSKPPAKFTWLFNGRILRSTQQFVIPKISARNTGYYTCLVHNFATHLSGTIVKNITVFAQLSQDIFMAALVLEDRFRFRHSCLERPLLSAPRSQTRGTEQAAEIMEPPSAPPHRRHIPWLGLLLTVSLSLLASVLIFWNPPITAQVTIEAVPFDATEGKDVLLLVHNLPGNISGYDWFKGKIVYNRPAIATYLIEPQITLPGPAYSHRETVYPNGSLLIQKVTQKDAGVYTLLIVHTDFLTQKASGQFHVHSE
ncbi:carcinoembryonic antigen-related cell adhesion molecule 8 [Fukomys damarensis]|uniref:carcinoembryonic antigen-related cell adhesion molecule 8 n=1 Tax=Fukomys damarensis TaxID=885580 RepID=UPI001455C3EC|nr:carcinoembryonic antigen-related cell adhesion molecule 8 [Fukomys damarensis]